MIKVKLSKGLAVGDVTLSAGEQFVAPAVAEALRGREGVTFPDEAAPAPRTTEFSRNMIGAEAKAAKARLLAEMGKAPPQEPAPAPKAPRRGGK